MEVVVAAAMMGGVALGVMQLTQNTTNIQREAGFSQAIASKEAEVQKFLLNSDVCFETLGGLDFSAGDSISPTAPVDIPEIKFARRDDDGNIIAGTTNVVQELHDANGPVPPDSNAGDMSGRMVFRKLYVTELKWVGDKIDGVDPFDKTIDLELQQAKLTIKGEFEKRPCAACGNRSATASGEKPRVVNKFFYVDAMFDIASNRLIKCYSAEGNAVATALKAACEAIDNNQDGLSDMMYDENTGECIPQEGTAACIYGGSYATAGNYINPATGAKSCPAGFQRVPAGHFMRPEEKKCGKSYCYNFYQQTYYNCVKCRTNPGPLGVLPASNNGFAGSSIPGVSIISGYAGCDGGVSCTGAATINTGVACTVDKSDSQCQAEMGVSTAYSVDNNGDGCYEACVDAAGSFPGFDPCILAGTCSFSF